MKTRTQNNSNNNGDTSVYGEKKIKNLISKNVFLKMTSPKIRAEFHE
ncbi:hypothetical protein HYX11_02250 [Candidatus Woesearchaeota archaeon]|nr:hypothetical protein [Candidatus Woesearchaeota archaeon]